MKSDKTKETKREPLMSWEPPQIIEISQTAVWAECGGGSQPSSSDCTDGGSPLPAACDIGNNN